MTNKSKNIIALFCVPLFLLCGCGDWTLKERFQLVQGGNGDTFMIDTLKGKVWILRSYSSIWDEMYIKSNPRSFSLLPDSFPPTEKEQAVSVIDSKGVKSTVSFKEFCDNPEKFNRQ